MISNSEKIYQSLITEHKEFLQTITEISKNTSDNRNFILSDYLALNFDLLQNCHPELAGKKEKSPDALFLLEQTFYFIEFKEGQCKKEDIRLKIHEGVLTLFNYCMSKKLVTKEEFLSLKIRYAVVIRNNVNGKPSDDFLSTLEQSSTFFNLKNIEGLIIEKTNVVFQSESILKLLRKVSNNNITSIQIADKHQNLTTVS